MVSGQGYIDSRYKFHSFSWWIRGMIALLWCANYDETRHNVIGFVAACLAVVGIGYFMRWFYQNLYFKKLG